MSVCVNLKVVSILIVYLKVDQYINVMPMSFYYTHALLSYHPCPHSQGQNHSLGNNKSSKEYSILHIQFRNLFMLPFSLPLCI